MPVTMMSAQMAAKLSAADLTYEDVGATASGLPPGYHHLRRTRTVGSGRTAFDRAAMALLGWQVHAQAGLNVCASMKTAELGSTVLLISAVGPLKFTSPCRVVYVISEADKAGFAYGTLRGHPESGEESFVLEQHQDGTVTFTITAFSRPATLLARIAGPFGRVVQTRIAERYIRALEFLLKPVLVQHLSHALCTRNADALIDRECLAQRSGRSGRVLVAEVAVADTFQSACLLQWNAELV